MNKLSDELRKLHEQANAPYPKPSPEQTTRAAEAMAGVSDQMRAGKWRDRVEASHRRLVALALETADALDMLEDALKLARKAIIPIGDVYEHSSKAFVRAKIDAALANIRKGQEP